MEKHTVNVPDVEGFARPRTRRDFFKTLAVASAGAAGAGLFTSKKAFAQIGGTQEGTRVSSTSPSRWSSWSATSTRWRSTPESSPDQLWAS